MKIGDIVRGKGGCVDLVLGIVVGYWKAGDKQQPLVKWLDGVCEGETFTELSEDLEVIG